MTFDLFNPPVVTEIADVVNIGAHSVPAEYFENSDVAYEKLCAERYEMVQALWTENFMDEYFIELAAIAIRDGYELRVYRYPSEKNKKGEYRNYMGEWQDEPVYSNYLIKRK